MKLGVNLYSVRKFLQNEEDTRRTFAKLREIGYEVVQLSGAAPMPAETVRKISRENGLPIVCTHSPLDRILHDTDALIRDHKAYGCPVIGLGALPKELRTKEADLHEWLATMREPVAKIRAAGLSFAYHNHDFEFLPLTDTGNRIYDILLAECPDWELIPDTYWIAFAGGDVAQTLKRIGAGRMTNVHFKDMARDEKRSICSCGAGVLDFASYLPLCESLGTKNILVEQDNANDADDPFGELEISYRTLRPLVK